MTHGICSQGSFPPAGSLISPRSRPSLQVPPLTVHDLTPTVSAPRAPGDTSLKASRPLPGSPHVPCPGGSSFTLLSPDLRLEGAGWGACWGSQMTPESGQRRGMPAWGPDSGRPCCALCPHPWWGRNSPLCRPGWLSAAPLPAGRGAQPPLLGSCWPAPRLPTAREGVSLRRGIKCALTPGPAVVWGLRGPQDQQVSLLPSRGCSRL